MEINNFLLIGISQYSHNKMNNFFYTFLGKWEISKKKITQEFLCKKIFREWVVSETKIIL
jgi:hypothetical protein